MRHPLALRNPAQPGLVAFALAIAMIFSAVVAAGVGAPASAAGPAYGFSLGGEMIAPSWMTQTRLAGLSSTLKGFGPRYVRVEISTSEPVAQQQAAISAVRASGAAPVVLLTSRGSDQNVTAPDPQAFANFAGSVARRFAGGVDYYEVLNEPNVGAYWAGSPFAAPDPVAYARVLVAASAAIKGSDPGARVLSGSPMPTSDGWFTQSPITWYRNVWAQPGVAAAVDIAGTHVYWMDYGTGALRAPDTGEPSGFGAVSAVRALTGKPVWVTEVGVSTCSGSNNCTTQANQLAYLRQAVSLFASQGVASAVLFYTARDESPDDTREYRFGVVDYNGVDKLAAPWIRTLMHQ